MSKKFKIGAMSLFIAIALGVSGCSSQSDQSAGNDITTLRFSHFWPATSATHKDIFEPWARKVEEESDGRLKVEIYPSATLSSADSTYESAANGTIDIGSQVQGYSNGRFPLTQIAELPGLSNSATQMNCMLQTLYDDGVISSEYEDTHLLFMMGTGPGGIHTIDNPIRKPEDLKGLRMRRPSAIAGDIIESAGGTPVGLPVTDLYTSLQRGVLDGLSLPWDAVGAFKLNELVNTHTNMPFYSSAILVTMNKDKYESLPDDLKKVIDDNSGKEMAAVAGKVFDGEDDKFMAEAKAKGDIMIDIPDPLSDPAWKGPLEAGTKKYLKDVEDLGLDAQTVYQKAKEASTVCES
ncbi:TRAP-type C4-dicarboxylate transport system substrate-binding protein [Psychrobacter sp. PL15]|uniref:TRAP transporter substrate-binding protein n=1 Tax=Psychrobacter sp. PL15 TaxID=3071719 RepID=UPI002E0038F5|nr:TRAP-type C4-dicarboxylate transport system substrate-binding protein [Psychrobacter sp. PL15]